MIQAEHTQSLGHLQEHVTEGSMGVQIHGNRQPYHRFERELTFSRGPQTDLRQDTLYGLYGHDSLQRFQSQVQATLAFLRQIAYSVEHEVAPPSRTVCQQRKTKRQSPLLLI